MQPILSVKVTIMKLDGFFRRDGRLENVGHKDSVFKKDIDSGDSLQKSVTLFTTKKLLMSPTHADD
jgi:hypothetical protein